MPIPLPDLLLPRPLNPGGPWVFPDSAEEEEKRQREAAKAARGGQLGARGSGRVGRWGGAATGGGEAGGESMFTSQPLMRYHSITTVL